jgi:hypothetical protein
MLQKLNDNYKDEDNRQHEGCLLSFIENKNNGNEGANNYE